MRNLKFEDFYWIVLIRNYTLGKLYYYLIVIVSEGPPSATQTRPFVAIELANVLKRPVTLAVPRDQFNPSELCTRVLERERESVNAVKLNSFIHTIKQQRMILAISILFLFYSKLIPGISLTKKQKFKVKVNLYFSPSIMQRWSKRNTATRHVQSSDGLNRRLIRIVMCCHWLQ